VVRKQGRPFEERGKKIGIRKWDYRNGPESKTRSGCVMGTTEAVFFKFTRRGPAFAVLNLKLSLRLNRSRNLRVARLRRAHVTNRKREHEKCDGFDPAGQQLEAYKVVLKQSTPQHEIGTN
jgi:hypothetical protein